MPRARQPYLPKRAGYHRLQHGRPARTESTPLPASAGDQPAAIPLENPSDLLRDQPLRRDLKGLVAARRYISESGECCLRIAFGGFDHKLDAESKQRSGAGIEVQTRSS